MRRVKLRHLALALVAVALAAPTAATTKATANEGVLNMIAWEGYLDAKWVKPFQAQSDCKVNAKYAGSSDEMVTLMRSGGGGQYDMVSASGDASLRLIYGGDVAAVDVNKVPGLQAVLQGLPVARRTTRSRASTTASRCSGARTRCSTTRRR